MQAETQTEEYKSLHVMGDIEPFVSTVDGSMITGRKALREHNLRNGVTNVADFKNVFAENQRKKEEFYSGNDKEGKKRRTEALVRSYDKLSRR
jgi:hypothetical protein